MTRRNRFVALLIGLVVVLVAALVNTGPGVPAGAEPGEGTTPLTIDAQRRITGGGLHSCAVLDTGHVRCWGQNDSGQLGNGTTSASTVPKEVTGITTALNVSGGTTHTCALLHDGTVRCWGGNGNGQIGNGSTSPPAPAVLAPVAVTDLDDATALSAGGTHTCALRAGGTVVCWGNNGSGQLGDGSGLGTSYVPVTVKHDHDDDAGTAPIPLTGVTAIAAGEFHTCAVLGGTGQVKCWGHNGFGQLGDDSIIDSGIAVTVDDLPDDDPHAHPPHKAIAIAAGEGHSCAVLDDNTARCWGHNFYGQLGNNTTYTLANQQGGTDSHVPVTVAFDNDPAPGPLNVDIQPQTGIVAISAGQFHTCATLSSGAAKCWGNNGRGQLGDNNPLEDPPQNKPIATPVAGLAGARAVTAGGFHTCALLAGNTMSCWGYNFYGQLGSYENSSLVPVTVTAVAGATTVTTGDDHVCALLTGTLTPPADHPFCWGNNANGELGANLTPSPADSTIRLEVFGLDDVGIVGVDAAADRAKLISAGNEHTCALPAPAGTPSCWGRNTDGELGTGNNTPSDQPVAIAALTNATQISAGGELFGPEKGHTCARASDGSAWCWGDNEFGQLGDESTTDRNAPVKVRSDDNNDHLNTPDPAITPPVDLTNVTWVSAGGRHSCALLGDGRVRCWGRNANGQLGDGTNGDRAYAVTVDKDAAEPEEDESDLHFDPLTGIEAIAAGARHSCAIKSDNTVWCWGLNTSGQLGNGTTTSSTVPVQVTGLVGLDPVAITAGDNHTCVKVTAATNKSGMVCWGENGDGQLGNNSTGDSSTPVVPVGLGLPGVDNVDLVKSISGGRRNTCAALIDETVSCWGDNQHGQLGDGVGPRSESPVAVLNLGSVGGNGIPAPVDDAAATAPLTPVVVNVLANDTDPDGDGLTVSTVQNPTARGTTTTNGTTVTYTPNASFCAADPTSNTDTFSYSVTDGTATVPAFVTITVSCPNTAPDAVDDAASTAEETAVSIPVIANDTDVNGDDITIAAGSVSDPPHGTAAVNVGGKGITYTPDPNFFGIDTFTYAATDGTDTGAPATVTVTVSNVNDPPVATDDVANTTEDNAVVVDVIANDTDVDGPSIGVVGVSDPAHGNAEVISPTQVRYTPDADHCIVDGFTYTVSDGTLTDTGSVTVDIACINDGPDAENDSATTSEDNAVVIAVLANDLDLEGDALDVTAASDPDHGTTTVNGDETVTYAPDPNFCGADHFSYSITDGTGTDNALVVPVVVLCTNDPPVAVDDAKVTPEDLAVSIEVLANDTDVDGDLLSVSGGAAPPAANGTVTFGSNNLVTYAPNANFCGADSFGYTVRDPSGAIDTGVVNVTVTCTNDAPVLAAIGNQTLPWGETLSIALSATDADLGDVVAFSVVAGPPGASIVGGATLDWTPSAAQLGTHAVTVRATDGTGAFDDELITVTVGKRATVLTYTGTASVAYSDPAPVSATLLDFEGGPVAGASVTFTIGTRSASAATGAGGAAGAAVVVIAPPSSTSVSAAFGGDAAYLASSTSAPFTVTKEQVVTTFLGGSLTTTAGSSAATALIAGVAEQADGNLGTGIATTQVTFTEVGGGVLCTATVAMTVPGAGTASCSTAALALGSRAIVVKATSALYTGPADVGAFAVAQVPAGSAAGAGRVVAGGQNEELAFQARPPAKKGDPTPGDAVHVYRSGATTAIAARTSTLTGLSRSCTSGKTKTCSATVTGTGVSRWSVDLSTGAVAALPAAATMTVSATDAAEPNGAGSDRYAVAIGPPDNHTAGSAASQLLLANGNVRVP